MSLFNGISRHPASFPFAASVDLARLAEVSGLLGLSLTAGQELQSLGVGLNQNYPDGFSSFSLDPDHQTALESLRQNQPAVEDHVVPALEALALKRAQMAARPSQAPMAATPGARLQRSRSIPAPGLLRPPMGGVAVPTSEGLIQFGTPMWLNKWVHRLYWKSGGTGIGRDDVKYKIPTYYIHDSEFSGPNVGLLPYDFIGYLGFPVESTVFTMVAEDAQQAARLRNYLDDSYLGKRHPDLSARVRAEYPEDAIGVPDLLAEMTQGFASPDPETLRRVTSFDEKGEMRIGENVVIRRLGSQKYEIRDRGLLMGQVDLRKYPARPPSSRLSPRETARAQEVKRLVLEEKRSGIWPLGTSDGFDAHGATSGLMLWNDGFALLVDPPSHTLDYFAAVGIPLDRIRGVIVTHGHSDHYADAIPKLVAARPDLKLYSTPTIYEMLQEQYRLALNRDDLKNWEFVPIRPMVETEINGMPFTVDYTFHTIPTIGFEIWREGELRFYFSGDTYADIERLEKLMNTDIDGSEEPVIGFWRGFRIQRHGLYLYWGSLQETPPVILMEGGMPPIHTPPASTRALLVQAKQDGINTSRFFVYHLSNKRARKEHVPKLREGAEGWIDLTPNASGS